MIKRGIDLNLRSLDRFSMLVHGDYNTFKTYMVGSFLSYLIRQDKRVVFWNVKGEDGYQTLAAFPEIDPKKHIWELETYQDIETALAELVAKPYDGLGIDSGKLWADKVMLMFTGGEDRPLRVPKGKGDHSQEWPLMHHKMERMMQAIRQCAAQAMITCPSDLSAHHLDPSTDTWTKEKRVTPNYPGNEATRASGWFDYVGYAEVRATAPGEQRRLLHFEYSEKFVSRARVITPFKEAIRIPDCSPPYQGPSAWEIVQAELKAHLGQKDIWRGNN